MKEKISALLDGEADDLERERVLRALDNDPELSATWERYHLLGTAIRHDLEVMASPGVAQRIHAQLRDEVPVRPGVGVLLHSRNVLKLGAGAAIAATVAAVALLNLQPILKPSTDSVAKSPLSNSSTKLVDTRQARPEQLNALNPYLMQHGEFTPAAGMNGMLSYVRVVGRNNSISENANAE